MRRRGTLASVRDELLDLERGFWSASGDPAFYERHVADEALFVFPAPVGVLTRAQATAAVAQATPWVEVELSEEHVAGAGRQAAIVAYRAAARRADGPRYEAYAGSVYVRRDGGWQLVFHQQTPVSEG